ncbi:hypothetical protein [Spirosoma sp. KUDC1026]|uniref:hypothetical protein n=1 Tax=Spirosoma sp. KUDC1026 TaxID=2745947 RepID=UPI00159BEF2B|nr:hypothetical protein [Spirosoma sp. KUDC1026]QKZ15897.1 hypothetical protein HU175_24575 [Spirosoma sp. KUDC1026]
MSVKLTKRQKQAVDRAKYTPIVQNLEPAGNFTYHFVDGGGIRSDVIKRLVDAGHLKASEDGLFPGHSQTWTA